MAEYSPFSISPDGQADDNPFRTVAKDMMPFGGMPIKAAPMDQSLMQRLYSGAQNQVTPGSSVDKLFGFHGDRYQFWPEKTLRSGAGAPMAAMTGEYGQPGTREFSENAVGPANDMTALMGTGMFRNTPSVGTFGGRLPSAVTRAIEEAPLKTGTPDQWAGYIRNRPGVGQEELQYGGVQKYLQDQPKGQVSQQALADFAKANQVELRDVTKGSSLHSEEMQKLLTEQQNSNIAPRPAPSTPAEWQQLSDRLMTMGQNRQSAGDAASSRRFFSLSEEAGRHAEGINIDTGSTAGMPKFSKYQTPGGENYREMLLTMPQRTEPNGRFVVTDGTPTFNMAVNTRTEAADIVRNMQQHSDRPLKIVEDRQLSADNFKSSHWDEPNALAHVRMNDRTINGKKTLFLEEIQSDWHQKGREGGYKRKLTPAEKAELEQLKTARVAAELSDRPGADQLYSNLVAQENRLQGQLNAVPDAPFKKSWHDLALKRMLVEAVEKGYDQIAWTTGDMQNARYDLSKHVQRILYNPESKEFMAWPQRGGADVDPIIHQRDVTPNKLRELIGVDAMERLLKRPLGAGGVHVLDGADLKIGGEGMRSFYDKMLPLAANKIGKVHGARVERGRLDYPKNSKGEDIKLYQKRIHDDDPLEVVHILHITPSLRKAIQNKQINLFNRGGRIGYANGGRIPHPAVAQLDRILAREQAFYASP